VLRENRLFAQHLDTAPPYINLPSHPMDKHDLIKLAQPIATLTLAAAIIYSATILREPYHRGEMKINLGGGVNVESTFGLSR
jgi:hypothetical protein